MGAGIEIRLCAHAPDDLNVAPFVGAGIEIGLLRISKDISLVAPFVGAGIEIMSSAYTFLLPVSRTLRGCGD